MSIYNANESLLLVRSFVSNIMQRVIGSGCWDAGRKHKYFFRIRSRCMQLCTVHCTLYSVSQYSVRIVFTNTNSWSKADDLMCETYIESGFVCKTGLCNSSAIAFNERINCAGMGLVRLSDQWRKSSTEASAPNATMAAELTTATHRIASTSNIHIKTPNWMSIKKQPNRRSIDMWHTMRDGYDI